jgi:alpha-tubulin suppressor-like RCC1 family protein
MTRLVSSLLPGLCLAWGLNACFPELPPEADTVASDGSVGTDAVTGSDVTQGDGVDGDTSTEPDAASDVSAGCEALRCAELSRACVDDADGNPICGACLEGFGEREGVCYRVPVAPDGVKAESDEGGIRISWNVAEGYTNWTIESCLTEPCANWTEAAVVPGDDGHWVDVSAPESAPPPAPMVEGASDPLGVELSWNPVVPLDGPAVRYRVRGSTAIGSSPPSAEVVGRRAPYPIVRYAVSIDGGPWSEIGLVTSWRDTEAPAPVISAGTATATEATLESHVLLALSDTAVFDGIARKYAVRALDARGPGEQSADVLGSRTAPTAWTVAWERSAGSTAEDFSPIPGATGNVFSDTGAPADGSVRFYRAAVSSEGLAIALTAAVPGSRKPPPGVPGNVRASTDLEDRVELRWNTVSGATGYRIFRNDVMVFEVSGGTIGSWDDTSATLAVTTPWTAPTQVTASTDLVGRIDVEWTAPPRPVGPDATYKVQSVSGAGPGGTSASVVGRRALPPIQKYEVEMTLGQQGSLYAVTENDTPQFANTQAPRPTLAVATVSAGKGLTIGKVALTSSTPTVTPVVVNHRVRGIGADNVTTPWSTIANGSRASGPVSVQWQRTTTDNNAGTWVDLEGATNSAFDDLTAPASGAKRWYRVVASAPGAESVLSSTSQGWRLAFTMVTAGASHSCARSTDGDVWCWGANDLGQLGRGRTSTSEAIPEKVGVVRSVAEVSAGDDFTCARQSDGKVFCWGNNAYGQLGDRSRDQQTNPVAVRDMDDATLLRAGGNHACALVTDGKVMCWGRNTWGQLGDDSTTDRLEPVFVLGVDPITPRAPEPIQNMTYLTAGFGHACAGFRDGVVCWGYNRFGRLGDGTETSRDLATVISTASVNRMAAGSNAAHTCMNFGSSGLYCWGSNSRGQVGVTVDPILTPTSITAVTAIQELAVGDAHSCARGSGGIVRCWGYNLSGQLGATLASGTQSPAPVDVVGLGVATAIAAGDSHTCAVAGGPVFCWGSNATKQLGDPDAASGPTVRQVRFP